MSGAATGGLLAARSGLKNMGKNALIGGVILAAIEGLGVVISRYVVPMMEQRSINAAAPIDLLEPPVDPLRKTVWKSKMTSSFSTDDNFFQPNTSAVSPIEISTQRFGSDSIESSDNKTTVTDKKEKKAPWSLW